MQEFEPCLHMSSTLTAFVAERGLRKVPSCWTVTSPSYFSPEVYATCIIQSSCDLFEGTCVGHIQYLFNLSPSTDIDMVTLQVLSQTQDAQGLKYLLSTRSYRTHHRGALVALAGHATSVSTRSLSDYLPTEHQNQDAKTVTAFTLSSSPCSSVQ